MTLRCSTYEWATGLIFGMKQDTKVVQLQTVTLFNEETQFSGDSSGTHDSDNVSGWNGVDSEGGRITDIFAVVCILMMQKH